jgi:hypothetical protein
VIKRKRLVAHRAEVVITPSVDNSGSTHLLIVVIPGFLPKNHKFFVLEKLGLGVLLVGRFIRTIERDVTWLLAYIACAGFRFCVISSRCP